MKKILVLLLLSLCAISGKAALFVVNNTSCTIPVVVKAHDINNGACGLQSNTITMAPGTSLSYADVTSLNFSPGWMGSAVATTTGGPAVWGFDALAFTFPSLSSQVGPPSGCAFSYSYTFANACSGNPATVTWYVIGSNAFVEFN